MNTFDNYHLRIDNIIDRYDTLLFRNPNIVGFGRGNKIVNGNTTNVPSLIIYVKKKLANNLIHPNNIIPKFINGAVTDVYESGKITTISNSPITTNTLPSLIVKPAVGGISIGCKGFASTLTCAVTEKGKRESLLLLSAAHALFPFNKAPFFSSDKIVHPFVPTDYPDYKNFIIATAKKFIKLIDIPFSITIDIANYNTIDAGIAYVDKNTPANRASKLQAGLYKSNIILSNDNITPPHADYLLTLKGADADPSLNVLKIGAITGKTSGKFISLNSKTVEEFKDPNNSSKLLYRHFSNVYFTSKMAQPGDSGALGLTNDSKKSPFGILFASTDNASIYCDITAVFKALNIEFL